MYRKERTLLDPFLSEKFVTIPCKGILRGMAMSMRVRFLKFFICLHLYSWFDSLLSKLILSWLNIVHCRICGKVGKPWKPFEDLTMFQLMLFLVLVVIFRNHWKDLFFPISYGNVGLIRFLPLYHNIILWSASKHSIHIYCILSQRGSSSAVEHPDKFLWALSTHKSLPLSNQLCLIVGTYTRFFYHDLRFFEDHRRCKRSHKGERVA